MANFAALAAVFAAGCVSMPLGAHVAVASPAADEPSPFVDSAHLDPTVPTPQSVVGHGMGDGAVRYEPMVRYLQALTDASPFVTLTPYAVTHEGRTLYHLTITSEANHARLAAIQADNGKLADPRKLIDEQEAADILENLPGIAWLAYSIHGDELSSTDAALQVAYQLAAGTDENTRRLRDELVIHIDPLMNPDGRERYLSQLQHLVGSVPNADYQAMQHSGLWSAGRGNHYLFDLNRDWIMQVHPETRGRAAKMLQWNPHLVVDSHEMGALDTYLFDPPREPINLHLSERTMNWRRRFSADQAKAFDKHGWSYYTGEWYEEWYPGYTNSWAGLQGAVGILYEQAGVNATAVKQASGRTLTYRDAVHHHVVSSLANLETLRANRRAILGDYLTERQWAVAKERSGGEVLLVPPPSDRPLFARFADLLTRNGIEFELSAGPCRARNVVSTFGKRTERKVLPAGTLVVHAAQPHRRLLRALLDFDPHMTDSFLLDERKDLENHRGTRMYDVSAWNLCMAYGLDAYWAESIPEVSPRGALPKSSVTVEPHPAFGHLINGQSSHIHQAVVRLLESGCKVRVARESFSVGGNDYDPGSVLLRRNENPADMADLLRRATKGLAVDVRSADTALSDTGPDLGGQRFQLLTPPRVAIASQWPVATSAFGAIWHLFDVRTGLRVSPINIQRLGHMDLRTYNVLLLPPTRGSSALGAILTDSVVAKLKDWIRAGGTLIAIGSSASFVAGKDRGLSAVRTRRDVLEQLDLYEEALARERRAKDVQLDLTAIWEGGGRPAGEVGRLPGQAVGTATGDSSGDLASRGTGQDKSDHPKRPSTEKLERTDLWQRMFRPRGVMARAELDVEHWLCYGLPATRHNGGALPVLLSSSFALMSKHPVQTPVRLVEASQLRLSGLLWPEARQRWAETAYATVERMGSGQIILFGSDPCFRGFLEATSRMLLNAVILGPGMGTSQPIPW